MASLTIDRTISLASLEDRTQAIGRALFAEVGGGPSVWERSWWDDRLMSLTLGDPLV